MSGMIEFYGSELDRFNAEYQSLSNQERSRLVDGFINTEPTKISWTRALKQDFARNKSFGYEQSSITTSLFAINNYSALHRTHNPADLVIDS